MKFILKMMKKKLRQQGEWLLKLQVKNTMPQKMNQVKEMKTPR